MQNLTKQLTLQNEVGAKIRYPKTEFLEATHSPKGSFLQALQSEALYGDNQGLVQLLEEPASNTNADTSNFYISSALLQDQFVHFLGVITSPMSLLIYGFASLNLPKEMQKATSLVPALQSNWLMMHVTVMILSYAALLCGSIFSMAFLFLNFLEKRNSKDQNLVPAFNKQKNRFTNENSMSSPLSLADKLDNYSYRVLALGFPLLTVGILSGAVWANQAWGSYWSWDPKESWALITWLVFAIYLHARITKGWNGEKPAIIATFGFFVIWFCYLGVNLLGTGLHSYGWFSK
ncbi:c-type cytochrome biogenesis protein CcsB [bacterium]|nr:MAG: c-type cytochrome biogenesis protein CcsB [bacterium]